MGDELSGRCFEVCLVILEAFMSSLSLIMSGASGSSHCQTPSDNLVEGPLVVNNSSKGGLSLDRLSQGEEVC